MENQGFSTTGTLGGPENPVPVIGIYIGGATWACILLMVHGVIFARKRWLPCIYFKFDSISMMLLSVTTMVSVDLTTAMPTRWDQFSKLTGTAFICICMGCVVFPSIGTNSDVEAFTNMVGFIIFVNFIIVNICMQFVNGVIVALLVEHIIILSLMGVLLLIFCSICLTFKSDKKIDAIGYTAILTRGPDTMFERLKLCFLHAHCTDPQFKISRSPVNVAVSIICLVCTAVVIEAGLRLLIRNPLGLDQGPSAYGWTTRYIVITQIAGVILGGTLIAFRSAAMFSRVDFQSMFFHSWAVDGYEKQLNQSVRAKRITLREAYYLLGRSVSMRVAFISQLLTVYPLWLASRVWLRQEDNCLDDFGVDQIAAPRYEIQQGIDEMIRLKDQVAGANPPYHSSRFLCHKPPSEYCDLSSMTTSYGTDIGIEVCTLSMVLLIKIAEASIPKHLLVSLLEAFHGSKEVIHYIDQAIPPRSSSKLHKLKHARALWAWGDLTCLLPDHIQPGQDHEVAVATIQNLKNVLCQGDVWDDAGSLIDIILRRNYSSIEELYTHIEDLFADMLHILFAQLPEAIFIALSKTPPEDFEAETKTAMELLFKIGSFDCQNHWKFPSGMLSMVNDDAPESKLQSQFRRLGEVVLVRVCPDSELEITKGNQELV